MHGMVVDQKYPACAREGSSSSGLVLQLMIPQRQCSQKVEENNTKKMLTHISGKTMKFECFGNRFGEASTATTVQVDGKIIPRPSLGWIGFERILKCFLAKARVYSTKGRDVVNPQIEISVNFFLNGRDEGVGKLVNRWCCR
jgi:hypothetical protein